MYVGVDYYPEHWPRYRWELDAELMQKAAFNVVRLAEFSWSKLEPEEGHYDFAWLDDTISVLNVQLGFDTGLHRWAIYAGYWVNGWT